MTSFHDPLDSPGGLFAFDSCEGDGGARLRGNSMGELWDVSGTWRDGLDSILGYNFSWRKRIISRYFKYLLKNHIKYHKIIHFAT
jgi:hypothetical protein